jgi:hypothetical protein
MSWFSKITGGDGRSGAEKGKKAHPPVSLSDVKIRIGSKEYPVAEIGVRSFSISSFDGDLIERQNFSFIVLFTLDGEALEFPGYGAVTHLTPENRLTAQFKAPQPYYDRKWIEFLAQLQLQTGSVKHKGGGRRH